MNTRVLLIGATGIVGGDLLDELAAMPGFSITATSRRPPTDEARANVRWLAADLAQAFDLGDAIRDADWVILNAASKVAGKDFAELEELRAVNIDAVSRIVSAMKVASGKRLLLMSSLALLKRPFADPITETDACAPATPYAVSKYWGECAARQLAEHCILRIPSPVPSEWRRLDGTVLKRWLQAGMDGGVIEYHGRGEREQDFVATADIAQACVRVIQTEARGLYHIASGQAVSMKALAGLVKERFSKVRVVQDASRDGNDGERWRVDITKACRELGYAPLHDAASAIDRMLRAA